MAPFPMADHSLPTNLTVIQLYQQYGPLFAAMRGKEWVLLPHAASADTCKVCASLSIIERIDSMKANAFWTQKGLVVTAVLGFDLSECQVEINRQLVDGAYFLIRFSSSYQPRTYSSHESRTRRPGMGRGCQGICPRWVYTIHDPVASRRCARALQCVKNSTSQCDVDP